MKVKVQYVRGGKVTTMHPRYAKILQRSGLVRLVDDEEEPKPKKKTREEKVTTEAVELSKRTGKPKRQYKRRDLKAEE